MIKEKIEDLALLGGVKAFSEPLYVGRPNIGNRERLFDRINDLLDRRWLTNQGPFVKEFELRIADFLSIKHCIAICNATVALEIAIRALKLHGEVIIPSFTFIATAHALQWQEITPVFCDVDPHTHNLDPMKVKNMITPLTTGIIGVNVWGRPCEIDSLIEIAQQYKLKLIFDAAHSFGCSYKGKMIGNFGDAEVFSFHATKFLNTFEGGVITTNNDDLAAKIRLMKNFGFAGYDNVIFIGTNGKMSEISASMGLTGLESINEFIEINYHNYKQYKQELAGVPGIKLIEFNEAERNNYQYIILEIDEKVTKINRDMLVVLLHAENIWARRYFYPGCHQMEPYRSIYPQAYLQVPETDRLAHKVLSLPTGTSVTMKDVSIICDVIKFVVKYGDAIRKQTNSGLT